VIKPDPIFVKAIVTDGSLWLRGWTKRQNKVAVAQQHSRTEFCYRLEAEHFGIESTGPTHISFRMTCTTSLYHKQRL
jgi:hypothetical protein